MKLETKQEIMEAIETFIAACVALGGMAFIAWLFITMCPAHEWPFALYR